MANWDETCSQAAGNKQKRTIYYKYFCDDDLGELQGFFEMVRNGRKIGKKLVLISFWGMNDADYRHEYMQSVFTYLGVRVQKLPDIYDESAIKLLKEYSGC